MRARKHTPLVLPLPLLFFPDATWANVARGDPGSPTPDTPARMAAAFLSFAVSLGGFSFTGFFSLAAFACYVLRFCGSGHIYVQSLVSVCVCVELVV